MKPTIHSTHVIGGGFAVVYDPFAARDGGTDPEPPTGVMIAGWPVANMNAPTEKGIALPDTGYSESFFAGNSVLQTARFWLCKNPANVATDVLLAAKLSLADSNSLPGSVVATSDAINAASLPDATSPIDFTFAGIQLTAGAEYCISVEQVGGTLGTDAIFVGHSVGVAGNPGAWGILNPDMGGWISQPMGIEVIFELYGTGDTAPPPVVPVVIDSLPVEQQNDFGSYGVDAGAGGMDAVFQAFQLTEGAKIRSLKVSLKAVGAPDGVIVCGFYTASGTFPAVLPQGSWLRNTVGLPMSEISPDGGLYELEFIVKPSMGPGIYAVSVERQSTFGPAGASVKVGFNFDFEGAGGAAHPGNGGYHQGGVWGADDMADMIFYLYGDPLAKKTKRRTKR